MNLEITEILYIYFNSDLTLDSNVDMMEVLAPPRRKSTRAADYKRETTLGGNQLF